MFSLPLYKQGMKGSWKLLVVLAAVLTMYFTLITAMFDPELGTALQEFSKTMPELMSMFGMDDAGTTLTGFMASYLYGFIMLVFPLIFSVITANRLVAHKVEHGSMAYLLAAPVSRKKVAATQAAVLLSGIFLLVLFATLVGIGAAGFLFPDTLDIGSFLFLNLGALSLQLFIGAICFFSSCLFNDTKLSIAFGAGIPALALIIQMLANAGEELENAKYATFFTLFNTDGILANEPSAFMGVAVLFGGALLLFTACVVVFHKKDIPV